MRGSPLSSVPAISVIVPIYKEAGSIAPFLARTVPILEALGSYEIIFTLDPSPDATEEVVREHIAKNPNVKLLVFSRRVGQPAAVIAGLRHSRGAATVVIDVDLQDPPEMIASMYTKMQEGYDVVYARRTKREGETLVKKMIAALGYKLINRIAEVDIPRNTGDFRIMSRRVVDAICAMKESHGFLRGMVALVGFKQTELLYQRDERAIGQGNYNRYFGSIKIGLNGVIGFSTVPLSFLLWLGVLIACLSFLAIIVMLVSKLVFDINYPLGIPTITITVLFLGGVQLIGIGVLGEYIGRIYNEVRARPLYLVDKAVNIDVTPAH